MLTAVEVPDVPDGKPQRIVLRTAAAPTAERARWKLQHPLSPYEPLSRLETIKAIARDEGHNRELLRAHVVALRRGERIRKQLEDRTRRGRGEGRAMSANCVDCGKMLPYDPRAREPYPWTRCLACTERATRVRGLVGVQVPTREGEEEVRELVEGAANLYGDSAAAIRRTASAGSITPLEIERCGCAIQGPPAAQMEITTKEKRDDQDTRDDRADPITKFRKILWDADDAALDQIAEVMALVYEASGFERMQMERMRV